MSDGEDYNKLKAIGNCTQGALGMPWTAEEGRRDRERQAMPQKGLLWARLLYNGGGEAATGLQLCWFVEKLLYSDEAQCISLNHVPTTFLACAVTARRLPLSALKSQWVWLIMKCNSWSKTNNSCLWMESRGMHQLLALLCVLANEHNNDFSVVLPAYLLI